MKGGTVIPAVTEWPALCLAWQRGTIEIADVRRAGIGYDNAAMLLSRMARRGLLRRIAHGHYEATHTRETTISYVMGEQ